MDFYFLLYSIEEKTIEIVKIFDLRFLTDLHVLGLPEHDFTVFTKCLSVCVCDKFSGGPGAKTDRQKCTKFYI